MATACQRHSQLQLRRRRDRSATDIYEKQTAARGSFASLYGKDRDFEVAAVSGKTPVSSKTLAEQVDQSVKFLKGLAAPDGQGSTRAARSPRPPGPARAAIHTQRRHRPPPRSAR